MDSDAPAFSIAKKDIIECLGKGLRIIEAFDDDHPKLTPSEAGDRCGITRTAARRYLLSLCHFGYADTDGKQFWLMPRILRLGQSYLEAARLPRLVQPFIQRISIQCGEGVNFSVLDGHEVVYLARSNGPKMVSIGFHAGARVPAHLVAPGIVLLATLDHEAVVEWLKIHEFSTFTSETVRDPDKLLEHIVAARSLGYWIGDRQLDPGLHGIAVALRNRKGECKGSLGITTSIQHFSREQMIQRLLPQLQETATVLRQIL